MSALSGTSRFVVVAATMAFVVSTVGGGASPTFQFLLREAAESIHSSGPASSPGSADTKAPSVLKTLTEAQLRAELSTPADFTAKDWSVDATDSGIVQPDEGESCVLDFSQTDLLAGMPRYATRTLSQNSTTHQIIETLGETPSAKQVVAQEKQVISNCPSTTRSSDDKDAVIDTTIGPADPATLGLAASIPALCRTILSISKNPEYNYFGVYCTIAVGDHIIQTREVSSDKTQPVTPTGFGSVLAAEIVEVQQR